MILGIGIGVLSAIVASKRPEPTTSGSAALVWIVTLAGIWLLASPFLLGFSTIQAATANNVVLGIGTTVLAGIVALARPGD